jgi:hypothetical protein
MITFQIIVFIEQKQMHRFTFGASADEASVYLFFGPEKNR